MIYRTIYNSPLCNRSPSRLRFVQKVTSSNKNLYEQALAAAEFELIFFRCRWFATKGKTKIREFKIPLKISSKPINFFGLPFQTIVLCFKFRFSYMLCTSFIFNSSFMRICLNFEEKMCFPIIFSWRWLLSNINKTVSLIYSVFTTLSCCIL